MITSYALEEYGRAHRESRLAEADHARLLATIPPTRETRGSMMIVALRYVRAALTSLVSVAFGSHFNLGAPPGPDAAGSRGRRRPASPILEKGEASC
jgi:hypothetical protein